MPEEYQLLNPPRPITCLAFNKDKTRIAFCPNNTEVHIYKKNGAKWEEEFVLKEHDKLVTSIDWAGESNRIVSCSQDRNAYVWRFEDGKWLPTLVILRINRAATQVKWSPKEDKFAVASGARCISVCYFEEDNNWWVSKHIKKPIKSTVLSVDWHPNNCLIACGASDFKMRVFSGYVKGLDKKPEATVWGSKMPFGELMGEFTNGGGGWVHDAKFSADGETVAWIGHDCSFSVVKGGGEVQTIKTNSLPFRSLMWVGTDKIVAAGHDLNPTLFSASGGSWSLTKQLDEGKTEQKSGTTSFDKFRQMDTRGQESGNDTTLKTIHQNCISHLIPFTGTTGAITKFVTIATDGKLITWNN